MTRRSILAFAAAFAALTSACATAQDHDAAAPQQAAVPTEDERAVRAVVETLFNGMRTGDSTMVRSVFHPQIRMVTSFRNQQGPQVSVESSLDGFVTAVGTPHAEVWDERISDLLIKTDGDFAMAWMNYGFFAGERFSHCGIDLMELVRTEQGWKIIALADTRRRSGCEEWTTPGS